MSRGSRSGGLPSSGQDAVRRVLEGYPVRLAVLFGSRATGDAVTGSDVDIAVEFERGVPHERRLELFVPLVTDLMAATGQDDVDLTELGDLIPLVGRRATREGQVVVGSPERLGYHRAAFERLAHREPTLRERADRVRRELSE